MTGSKAIIPALILLIGALQGTPAAGSPDTAPGAADAERALALRAYAATRQRADLPCQDAAHPPAIDLAALVIGAFCHRRGADIADADIAARQARVDEARASLHPIGQLSAGRVQTQSRYFGDFGYTDRNGRDAGSVSLSWRAYDFGARQRRIEAADRDVAAGESSAHFTQLASAIQVTEVYHEALSLRASLAIGDKETPLLTQLAAAQDALASSILPAGADAHSARLRLLAHQARLDSERTQWAKGLARLAGLTGVDVKGRPWRVGEPGASFAKLVPLETLLARAADEHPAARAARAARDAARLRVDEARRAALPSVDVNVGRYVNRSTSTSTLSQRGVIDEASVQLTWTFYDGFGAKHRSHGLAAEAQKAEHVLFDTLDDIATALRAGHAEMQAFTQALQAARARLTGCLEAQEQVQRRLAARQQTRIDLLEVQLACTAAERDVTQLEVRASLSWYRLALDAGSLDALAATEPDASR